MNLKPVCRKKYKKELLEVKRVITPLIDICNRLMRFDIKLVPDDTRPYFRDVYDHAIRINEMLETARDLVTAALEANFSLSSISQSEVSKKFAGWAAIIGVPTMIAGIYGMNFDTMPELRWTYAYPVVLIFTFSLCIILYIFLGVPVGCKLNRQHHFLMSTLLYALTFVMLAR